MTESEGLTASEKVAFNQGFEGGSSSTRSRIFRRIKRLEERARKKGRKGEARRLEKLSLWVLNMLPVA